MDIECFNRLNYSTTLNRYILETPVHIYNTLISLREYTVQKEEEMRIDLIVESIYGDSYNYSNVDVLLYINGIDNPLNIKEGQVIVYPSVADLTTFRYTEDDKTPVANVKSSLGVVNKETRTDKSRSKFVEEDYSLPPVVLNSTEPPVKIGFNNILVGGLK